ncbi:MAG TPA: hypothetical protein VFJ05_02910, partial [Nitrososphaeraceae archaeon]|nr:hypothetical protein [Nitrososphaeraceae archaeon]
MYIEGIDYSANKLLEHACYNPIIPDGCMVISGRPLIWLMDRSVVNYLLWSMSINGLLWYSIP